MKTILHAYRFNLRKPDQKAAWDALEARLRKGPRCLGPVLSDVYKAFTGYDGKEVELSTSHLFANQWNMVDGPRVFEWALEFRPLQRYIRQGHYLEQTKEMTALRRSVVACGYCGKQVTADDAGPFHLQCQDSEYLQEGELHLTRMVAVADSDKPRAPLTEAESAFLVPRYQTAQLHGTTECSKARTAAKQRAVANKYASTIAAATKERDGFTWLFDRNINTYNVIYYAHTRRFSFGWRTPLSAAGYRALLDALGTEFPFDYDIKREGGAA